MINTKTLAIGQDVYVVARGNYYFRQGVVTKIAPNGVQVLAIHFDDLADRLSCTNWDADHNVLIVTGVGPDGPWKSHYYYQQAADELSRLGDDLLPTGVVKRVGDDWDFPKLTRVGYDFSERFGVVPMQFDNEGNNGSDGMEGWDLRGCSPWHIDDIPFAERRASAKQKSQDIPFHNAGR